MALYRHIMRMIMTTNEIKKFTVNSLDGLNKIANYKDFSRPYRHITALFGLICLLISILPVHAGAFAVPERFEYELTWAGINAGSSVIEIKKDDSGIQIISRAWSNKFVSTFYRVENLIVSTIADMKTEDAAVIPKNYRLKIREGRHRRDKEYIFNQGSKTVTYINHIDKEKVDFDISNGVLDMLSGFFHARRLPMEIGKSVFIDVFDSKKLYKVEIQVLRKETINTPAGSFKTIVVKPILKTEGIFLRKGDVFIWLSDDEKRVPVQLRSTVAVGSINATLTSGQF
ncbi:MAG: DUF3108 domain-containing protein [Nitrospirae bacterium]|nr:DUF3108 domain-containing protein [Nitrospirota bacterium]